MNLLTLIAAAALGAAADQPIPKAQAFAILKDASLETICDKNPGPFLNCFKLDAAQCRAKAAKVAKAGFRTYDPKGGGPAR